MDSSFVQINNVNKEFSPGNKVLSNINLSIEEGDIFALLGPSGCGKSTLLRMIAGFEQPDSGNIIINGQDVTDLPPYKRPLNMMFQSYALFPHMTVEQNIAFGLRQDKLGKVEISKRVDEALEIVKMPNYHKRKPHQLSGGQQQRIALARSIVKKPKLLLLDEPLAAIDRKTKEHTQMELINIQALLKITFIMVTHDQEEAMAMADNIGVMNNGKLLQVGKPNDIYEYPSSLFIADFIGPINIFTATVSEIDGNFVVVDSSDATISIRVYSENKEVQVGQQVWVAVRPEEMDITLQPSTMDENEVNGKIIDIAFMGDKVLYHLKLASEKIIHVSLPTAARNNNQGLRVGTKAYANWYYTDGVLLDK